jgi:hypothetical protein
MSSNKPIIYATIKATVLNGRSGPGRDFEIITTAANGVVSPVLETKTDYAREIDPVRSSLYEWHRLELTGKPSAWYRGDYLNLSTPQPAPEGSSGGIVIHEPPPTLLVSPLYDSAYPAPVVSNNITNEFTGTHIGWDLAADDGKVGALVYGGPLGGECVVAAFCEKCGSAGSSSLSNGRLLNDQGVLSDERWNYGYGHYLVVRYDNSILPTFTRQYLLRQGWGTYDAFVMYAHLQEMRVRPKDTFAGNAIIGVMGNSGNSDGPHLHLELRFGKVKVGITSLWARVRPGLSSPAYLFSKRRS